MIGEQGTVKSYAQIRLWDPVEIYCKELFAAPHADSGTLLPH